jgi:hypothetical protein
MLLFLEQLFLRLPYSSHAETDVLPYSGNLKISSTSLHLDSTGLRTIQLLFNRVVAVSPIYMYNWTFSVKSVSVSFCGSDGGELLLYDVYPWTRVDPRLSEILGIADPKLRLSDLGVAQLDVDDEVLMVDFDETNDLVVVQNLKSIESIEELEGILETELVKKKGAVAVSNPKKGEVRD